MDFFLFFSNSNCLSDIVPPNQIKNLICSILVRDVSTKIGTSSGRCARAVISFPPKMSRLTSSTFAFNKNNLAIIPRVFFQHPKPLLLYKKSVLEIDFNQDFCCTHCRGLQLESTCSLKNMQHSRIYNDL